jgi:hypothetical protein
MEPEQVVRCLLFMKIGTEEEISRDAWSLAQLVANGRV